MGPLRHWLAAALLAFAAPAFAQGLNVAGVKYDDTLDLRGAKLHLNGAGIRYKFVVKVYTAGLYLPKKAATPEEVIGMQGPKRISITMLREIDSNELGKLFTRAVEDNTPKGEMSKLVPGLIRMSQLFSDCKKLNAGDTFTIDWVPGTGTFINVGNPKCPAHPEPYKEPEFYNALLRIWLGPAPADWKLKDALLGKPAA
jgi:hypothetical protein